MYKKISIIIALALLLALFLYIKPFKEPKIKVFNIEQILPEADVVGRLHVLEFLKETTDLLIFNKVQSRQFLTYEFMLSMAKKYGIDLQSQIYLFANDRGDYGFVVPLLNSNKLDDAFERIEIDFEVSDTLINKEKVLKIKEEDVYFFKRDKYAVFYKGKYFDNIYNQFSNKSGEIRESWKMLFSNPYFSNEHLVLYTKSPDLNDLGISHVFLAHDSDSTEFYLKSRVIMNDSIPFLINNKGKAINYSNKSNRIVDLHLNFGHLNGNTKEMIASKLKNISSKISFPMREFIDLWAGDLCFEEGGFYQVTEKYIETELDENFVPHEIEKSREIIVPRYKLMVSTLKSPTSFINKLLGKGILTKEEGKYRFLFSPLFNMLIYKEAFIFYSSETIPEIVPSKQNVIRWDYKGIELNMKIDSSINNTLYGGVRIPAKAILKNTELY